MEAALLLGLTGVRTVCLNQWHCTLFENAEKLDFTMKGINIYDHCERNPSEPLDIKLIEYIFVDLLAGGQTIGQAIRLLFTPYRRPKPELEGILGKHLLCQRFSIFLPPATFSCILIIILGEEDKQSGSDKSKQTSEETEQQNKEEEETINISRSWYNMVCYGAPNLMVTQLSKP